MPQVPMPGMPPGGLMLDRAQDPNAAGPRNVSVIEAPRYANDVGVQITDMDVVLGFFHQHPATGRLPAAMVAMQWALWDALYKLMTDINAERERRGMVPPADEGAKQEAPASNGSQG